MAAGRDHRPLDGPGRLPRGHGDPRLRRGGPAGTYTYTVTAVYQSWTASGTSSSIGVLSAPTITSMPANPSASGSASFSFSGGGASSYQCQLDGGSFSSCASPNSHTGLAD